jgi:hypothetical protein
VSRKNTIFAQLFACQNHYKSCLWKLYSAGYAARETCTWEITLCGKNFVAMQKDYAVFSLLPITIPYNPSTPVDLHEHVKGGFVGIPGGRAGP